MTTGPNSHQSNFDIEPANSILCGMPDFSDGQAGAFLRALSEDDRDIVTWYVQQGFNPAHAGQLAINFARGYAAVDPERTAHGAMESAHVEIARLQRFLAIFLETEGFFPALDIFNISVRDEQGNYEGNTEVRGWTRFGDAGSGGFATNRYRDMLRRSNADQHIASAHHFIDDPLAEPRLFNQAAILEQVRKSAFVPAEW